MRHDPIYNQQEHYPQQLPPKSLYVVTPSQNVDSTALTSQHQEKQQEKEPGLIVGLGGGQTKGENKCAHEHFHLPFECCLEHAETSVVCLSVCLCELRELCEL